MPTTIPPTFYDPTRILVTFGLVPLLGRAPGASLKIRRDVPIWTSIDGTNGELKRRRSRKKSGTIDVVLRGTAPANRGLGTLAKIDETHGSIIQPLVITDTLSGALYLSQHAYIEMLPDMNYSTVEGDITWRFKCDELDMSYPGVSIEGLARLGRV
jgi:hypothetical protein